MKIAILGYSGSGKSTLAHFLSENIRTECLHLDQVHFSNNWIERPDAEAKSMVSDFMEKTDWIIDGNYTNLYHSKRLEEADQIILLLFSRWAALRRVLARYNKFRGQTRPDMGDGCNEKIDCEFIWWILYKGRTKHKQDQYNNIQKKYPDKTIIIRNQRELDKLYQEMKNRNQT
ncbi:DNA topology modulation protein FlaR [Blautia liquoris]|jgi:adenylate kinase family enzyme|uniref:DNA topology modulation protein FlaR n=1 Tax=Blautia liquoris TaxID=2779518 RepID=A0A7M2RJ54_9FIRM|nr:DNA topology modulation protein FlaR [Blautia liquoris]QOV20353.1 DNA topology modulation protein FlaR [Blautia liquoris]